MRTLKYDDLLEACADDGAADGIRFDAELEPIAGPGGVVRPATYVGGKHQRERRWMSVSDDEPTEVIVIDNVPSQANRLEDALRADLGNTGAPEFVLDLSDAKGLPPHLPKRLSSLQFPHRHADAYLRDSNILLGGEAFQKSDVGKALFNATAQNCDALLSYFPQSLLFGFWQSYAGQKSTQAKHARTWVSEIVGWGPPAAPETKVQAIRRDPLNLNVDDLKVERDAERTLDWKLGTEKAKTKLSEIGHGSILATADKQALAAVSFARITQRATLSFAQLRRVRLGNAGEGNSHSAARALVACLGIHAHVRAFLSGGFCLRSGADLRASDARAVWLSSEGDDELAAIDAESSLSLLREAKAGARNAGLRLAGWDCKKAQVLKPHKNLQEIIERSWGGKGA